MSPNRAAKRATVCGVRRDLRHEHDDAAAGVDRPLGGAQVDLRLAGARDPVEEVRPAARDRLERRLLLAGERRPAVLDLHVERRPAAHARLDGDQAARLQPAQHREVAARGTGQPRQRLALQVGQRLRAVEGDGGDAPQLRALPPRRRQDEAERPGRRRAVLARHPQRAVDELGRDGVRQDRGWRDEPLLGHLAVGNEPGDHPGELLVAEGDPDDRSHLDRLGGQPVVERAAEAARRRQRLDPGDHGRCTLEVATDGIRKVTARDDRAR